MLLTGSGQVTKDFKAIVAQPDDRLKENDVIIKKTACETLPKLIPQLYNKKPDMENTDSTTWIKQSGIRNCTRN